MAKKKPATKKQGKKNKSSVDKSIRGKSFTQLSLTSFLGASLSIIIISVLLFVLVLVPQAKNKAHTQAQTHVANFGNQLDLSITHLQLALDGISQNEKIGALLSSQDQKSINEKEKGLKFSLPYALGLHLFPVGTAKINRDIFPPVSFASLDMVQKAELGKKVSPEVQKFDQRLILTMVKSIPYQGKTVGVILAHFEFKNISDRISGFDPELGYFTLTQTFENGKTQQIIQAGNDKWQQSAYQAKYKNKIGNWETQFSMSPPLEDSNTFILFYVIAVAVMTLATLLFISFGLRKIELEMRKDSTILLALSEQIAEREHLRRKLDYKFNTLFFASIGHTMERFLEDLMASDLKKTFQMSQPQTNRASANTQVNQAPPENNPQLKPSGPGPKPEPVPKPEPMPEPDAPMESDSIETDPFIEEQVIEEQASESEVQDSNQVDIPQEIFRAYDIRGVVGKTLTSEIVQLIGKAIGSESLGTGQTTVIVARDGRLSGPDLQQALIAGITASGCNVINLGMAPTPMLYFACNTMESKSGVMLTGSHNPADYNGLKIVINGETLSGERIQDLYKRIANNSLIEGEGSVEEHDIKPEYFKHILDDVILATNIKVVVDCGNGVAGMAAPELLTELGCEVVPLYCEVDGNFPNHHPDPSKPENLKKLIETIQETSADIGLAFDGDGDRLGVVTNTGKIIWSDRLMMLYAKDLLVRSPGADIIYDVKCSRNLGSLISELGGRPMMWKTGHSFIKAKLKETNAALAGEMSGHIFFNDRWFGFDDALYSAARLLEIITTEQGTCDEIFASLPEDVSTPEINIQVPESRKFQIIQDLQSRGQFGKGEITDIDGVRVDFPKAWGLIRASNTTPCLVARFEAKNEEALGQIQSLFKTQLLEIDGNLKLPF